MIRTIDLIDEGSMARLADEAGVAVAIVDESSREITVANNNSICRSLNKGGEFSPECARFCGRAFAMAEEAGEMVRYECHAGLECRAVIARDAQDPVAVIMGRTFVKAENYHRATERAIDGDWRSFRPTEFFNNILLMGSVDTLDKTVRRLEADLAGGVIATAPPPAPEPKVEADDPSEPDILTLPEDDPIVDGAIVTEKFDRELIPGASSPQMSSEPRDEVKVEWELKNDAVQLPSAESSRTAEARAWRSFFSSLLKTDYSQAVNSILEFLAHHYGFEALVWLERIGDTFENTAAYGMMKDRRIRLGLSPADRRLAEAFRHEMPLELGERSSTHPDSTKTMFMFPIGIDGDISAAIATLDAMPDERSKHQIARMCHSIAQQLEILRLRSEVERSRMVSSAVRRFSESLKRVDTDDLWLTLTQNAAEMLGAERASLLLYDDRSDSLAIKSMIGSTVTPPPGEPVGRRVARTVLARNETVVVPDVNRTNLKPAPAERNYRTSSFLSCPIAISGRSIGVMNFTDRVGGRVFDNGSLELFQAIAPQLAVAVDRATLKEKAGAFEQLSVTDPLTGLLNRRYMEARLLEEVKRSNRHSFPMSFLMLDVDHFKSYNDVFGHPAGDEALKLVGHVIRETLRGADVAARFGGEEFCILLPQTTNSEAATIAERIRANIEQTRFPHREVTVSIGFASCSADLCSATRIVSAADKAMYQAKRSGRNQALAFEMMNADKVRDRAR